MGSKKKRLKAPVAGVVDNPPLCDKWQACDGLCEAPREKQTEITTTTTTTTTTQPRGTTGNRTDQPKNRTTQPVISGKHVTDSLADYVKHGGKNRLKKTRQYDDCPTPQQHQQHKQNTTANTTTAKTGFTELIDQDTNTIENEYRTARRHKPMCVPRGMQTTRP
jgi:hypothetical protein